MTVKKEYFVVVTGAADVKLEIPDRIEREGHAPINVIKFHHDSRNVLTDMDIIPKLWSRKKKDLVKKSEGDEEIYVDAMLHMGITSESEWEVEKVARCDGYDWVGDDNKPLPNHIGGEGERWEGLPKVLKTAF